MTSCIKLVVFLGLEPFNRAVLLEWVVKVLAFSWSGFVSTSSKPMRGFAPLSWEVSSSFIQDYSMVVFAHTILGPHDE